MAEGGQSTSLSRNLGHIPQNVIDSLATLGLIVRVDDRNLVLQEDMIGRGSESIVIRGHRQEECAIKYINLMKDDTRTFQFYNRVQSECNTLKELIHPNIVRTYEIVREMVGNNSDTRCAIVMERCWCDLKTFMLRSTDPLKERAAKDIAWQIGDAVAYLHQKNWYHCDIKLSNILLTDQQVARLSDFGFAQRFKVYTYQSTKRPADEQERQKPVSNRVVGTPGIMAPEVLDAPTKAYSVPEAEMWTLGVLLRDMLMYPPSFGRPGSSLSLDAYRMLARSERYNWVKSSVIQISAQAEDLIRKLIVADPEKRLNIIQFLTHPFFKGQKEIVPIPKECERPPTMVTLSPPKPAKELGAKPGKARVILEDNSTTFKVSKMPAFLEKNLITHERNRSSTQSPARNRSNTQTPDHNRAQSQPSTSRSRAQATEIGRRRNLSGSSREGDYDPRKMASPVTDNPYVPRLEGERDVIYKMRLHWIPKMPPDWDHVAWARKQMQSPGPPRFPNVPSSSSEDSSPQNPDEFPQETESTDDQDDTLRADDQDYYATLDEQPADEPVNAPEEEELQQNTTGSGDEEHSASTSMSEAFANTLNLTRRRLTTVEKARQRKHGAVRLLVTDKPKRTNPSPRSSQEEPHKNQRKS